MRIAILIGFKNYIVRRVHYSCCKYKNKIKKEENYGKVAVSFYELSLKICVCKQTNSLMQHNIALKCMNVLYFALLNLWILRNITTILSDFYVTSFHFRIAAGI